MIKTPHNNAYKILIENLIAERNRQGLSVRQLAEKLGTFHSLIIKTESRERRLSVIEFVQYAKALNLDYCALLKEFDDNLTKEAAMKASEK